MDDDEEDEDDSDYVYVYQCRNKKAVKCTKELHKPFRKEVLANMHAEMKRLKTSFKSKNLVICLEIFMKSKNMRTFFFTYFVSNVKHQYCSTREFFGSHVSLT